jgi:two-component system, cell cycle sensor histidine kinase and response regulator CckA
MHPTDGRLKELQTEIDELRARLADRDARLADAQSVIQTLRDVHVDSPIESIERDIIARKEVETALRASERRERERAEELATLLDAVPTPVIIVHDADGTHMTGNRAADELLRMHSGEEVSLSATAETRPRHFRTFKDGCELTADELPAQRAARGAHVRDFEFTLVFDDGSVRHLLGYGTPLREAEGRLRGAVHVLVDITERKRAEKALKELNESLEQRVIERTESLRQKEAQASALAAELQTVMETVPAITFVAQDPQCLRMTCNRMTREILRLPEGANPSRSAPEPERPTSFRAVKDGVEIPAEELPMQLAAATGREVRDAELTLVFEDGTHLDILGNASPLLDESGKPRGAVGAFIDITDRKRAEHDRLEMQRRLLHAQKLESIGVMAGGIAHDFNNILAGIMGYAEILRRSLPSSDRLQADIEVIKNAVKRATDLTRQMLAYSGKGKIRVEPVHLSRVVKDSEAMLDMAISKKAAITYDLAPLLPLIQADPSQICQVLMNLVINASESLGEQGGLIAVSSQVVEYVAEEMAAMFPGDAQPEDRYVCLQVADTGCGMYVETLARIFDPFFTTKFAGRGPGLAAVHGIVQGHKGGIQVASEPGKGTTFRVFFPAGGPAVPIPQAESEAEASDWQGSGKVLVVDDEEIARNVGRTLIEQIGFRVVTAKDGDEAVLLYREHRDEIVCVLLDLTMPKMNGEETFRELLKIDPGVRVVLSSGYGAERAMDQFAGLGLAGFIQKPYQFESLVAVLRAATVGAPEHAPVMTLAGESASKATSAATRSVPLPVGESVAGARDRRACTVLVVDDDRDSREAMQFFLQEADFATLGVEDGEEAVGAFRAYRDEIVGVFLDVNLPKKDGVETFRELRQLSPEVPIVVVAGESPAVLRRRFAGLDVFDFVCKPESPEAVIDRLWESIRSGARLSR